MDNKFMILTRTDGHAAAVRKDSIICIEDRPDNTVIHYGNSGMVFVKENYRQVLKKLTNSYDEVKLHSGAVYGKICQEESKDF